MEDIAHSIECLNTFSKNHRGWLFRGQSNPTWLLRPTLERAAARCEVERCEFERAVFIDFQRQASSFLPRLPHEESTLEWLAVMQHYGAPTRLLDFTYSFWIAVYFAYEFSDSECSIWAVDPKSLARESTKQTDKQLLNSIEKANNSTDKIFYCTPFYLNERLGIQQGEFLFTPHSTADFHNVFVQNKKTHFKLTIPKHLFAKIRELLNEFNCNSRTLMPGIDGYSRYFQNPTIPFNLPPRKAGVSMVWV